MTTYDTTTLASTVALPRPLILALMFLLLASSLRAQGNPWKGPQYSARDVHVRIEVGRASYRTGDSLNVRLTLRNQSNHAVTYSAVTANGLVRLRVLDAAGHEVKPAVAPAQVVGGNFATLGPRAAIVLKSLRGNEWINLRDWGYDLRTPGTHTIVGIPLVAGPKLTPDHKTVRSNETTFAIEP